MKLLLFTIVVFHCTYSEATTTEIREFEKKWISEDNVIYFVSTTFNEDKHFIYATCIKENHDKDLNCNVTTETPIIEDAPHVRKSCKLKRIADENRIINKNYGLEKFVMLGHDRILLTGYFDSTDPTESSIVSFMVTILQLKTCSTIDLMFYSVARNNTFVTDVLPYEDTFDVIISSKAMCGAAVACKITYDKNGNIINGPVPFAISGFVTVYSVALESPVKGFFGLGVGYDGATLNYTLKYLSPDNIEKNLLFVHTPSNSLSLISNSYEKVAICSSVSRMEPDIHCFQFDPELQKTIINKTFKLDLEPDEYITVTRVYNLKEGGLLLTTLVRYGNSINGKPNSLKLIVTKISPGGYQDEVAKIDNIDGKCNTFFPAISERNKEFCFYVLCSARYDGSPFSSHLSATVKCIPNVLVYGS